MNVELSAATVKKAEELVRAGNYPDIDSAIAAALDVLQCPICKNPESHDPLDAEAEADIIAGRTRVVDDAYLRELRAKAEAIIAAKRQR